jgi:osmotically-inducible protein OsmY
VVHVRFLAFLILCALVGGGLLLWRSGGDPDLGDLAGVPAAVRESALARAVETALDLNARLRPYDIEVRGDDDVITLGGAVPNLELRSRAAELAGSVPGVSRVENELVVDPDLPEPRPEVERTSGERLDDWVLELRARLAFRLDRELEYTDIEVASYRGELTLAGEVRSASQRERALETARDLSGVEQVTDRLRVREAPLSGEPGDVARRLADSPALSERAIRVVTEEGRLVLQGEVASQAERELAEALARAAADRPVVNQLVVLP